MAAGRDGRAAGPRAGAAAARGARAARRGARGGGADALVTSSERVIMEAVFARDRLRSR